MLPAYPKRPPFFAYRFCRLMVKVCLANEIGSECCWLLTAVAMTEDAKGYRDAVTFFNGQLVPLVGCGSEDSFARVRSKAVRAGWLHYQPGGKGRAGKYWVQVPERFAGVDDAPTDERPDKYLAAKPRDSAERTAGEPRENRGTSADQTAGEPRDKCGEKPGTSAEHSSLTLTHPLTQECAVPAALDTPEFRAAWEGWKAERRAKRHRKYTPDGEAAILAKLSRHGLAAALWAIGESTAQGWQGLFPEKYQARAGPQPFRDKTTQYAIDTAANIFGDMPDGRPDPAPGPRVVVATPALDGGREAVDG